MNCRKVRRNLFGYFKSELPAEEREQIKAHLQVCSDCAKEAEQIEAMCLMLSDNLETLAPSPDFNDRLLEKVNASPSEAAARNRRSWWAELLHEIFPSVRLRWALAGAVGVLVVAFAFMFTQKQTPVRPDYTSRSEGETENQVAARSGDASDSAYAELMRRLADSSSVSQRAFVIDNFSFPSAWGEGGDISQEDLYKRFVIERMSPPTRQPGVQNHYVLPVVSTQKVSGRADY